MSSISRIAFNLDTVKKYVPEHEANFIIDSYFAYLVASRKEDDAVSFATDDVAVLTKNSFKDFGVNTCPEGDALLQEADESLNLRIAAREKYAKRYGGEVFDAPHNPDGPHVEDKEVTEYQPATEGDHPSINKSTTEEIIDIFNE